MSVVGEYLKVCRTDNQNRVVVHRLKTIHKFHDIKFENVLFAKIKLP